MLLAPHNFGAVRIKHVQIAAVVGFAEAPRQFCPATLTRVLTITWLADAAVLISMQLDPTSANPTFLLANAMIWGLTAIASLVLTGGRHRSWIFFLPISAITAARGLASIN